MAGGAAGGFVTRAFDSMLKECSGKKFPELHKAIQNYTGFNHRSLFQVISSLSNAFFIVFLFQCSTGRIGYLVL